MARVNGINRSVVSVIVVGVSFTSFLTLSLFVTLSKRPLQKYITNSEVSFFEQNYLLISISEALFVSLSKRPLQKYITNI